MRCTWRNREGQGGFTLIEVLIIAPVVILAISGFVALMITMIGDSLTTRDQNLLIFETQDALNRIEQDTRLTTQFLETSLPLPSPQGSDSNYTGTAAFTSTNSLILGELTTDKNPADSTRQLVYYANQPNDCGSLQTYNRVFQGKIMYFLYNGSLWRRSYVPDYNTTTPVNDSTVCSAPWQQNTCSPGYTAARCQTNDTEVMKNVDTFTVKYLDNPDGVVDLGPSQALAAGAIEVTITGKKTIKGRQITSSSTLRATRLNAIDVDLPIPNAPTVTASPNSTSVVFNWQAVPNATSYLISYNINGGSWINDTVDNRTLSYTVSAGRSDTVTIRVTSKNSTGTSTTYGTAAGTVPLWTDCGLPINGWQNYSTTPGYAGAAYTKTKNDIVVMKGTIKSGTITDGTLVCTLPVGLRPAYPQIFQNSSPDAASRIDVWPDGSVTINNASATWVSLENIRFVASTAAYTWNNLTLGNLWTNFGSYYPPALQYTTDTVGRVIIRGMIVQGTYADGTLIAQLPATKQPSQYLTIPTRGATGFNAMGINNAANSGIVAKGINPGGWYSPQTIYYPNTFAGWSSMTLLNSWVNLGGVFSTAQYTKGADGLVTLKGMIKSGVASSTLPVAQLPAGYRPKERMLVSATSAAGYARFDIDVDGKIYPVVASSTYTCLDGISFMGDL